MGKEREKASPVTVTHADGSTEIRPAYSEVELARIRWRDASRDDTPKDKSNTRQKLPRALPPQSEWDKRIAADAHAQAQFQAAHADELRALNARGGPLNPGEGRTRRGR